MTLMIRISGNSCHDRIIKDKIQDNQVKDPILLNIGGIVRHKVADVPGSYNAGRYHLFLLYLLKKDQSGVRTRFR